MVPFVTDSDLGYWTDQTSLPPLPPSRTARRVAPVEESTPPRRTQMARTSSVGGADLRRANKENSRPKVMAFNNPQ
jgi:hypothetical protein